MSIQNRLADLRQKLERWKSNNEVHAKPADAILYDFLNGFLTLADGPSEYESPKEAELPEPIAPESQPLENDEATQVSEDPIPSLGDDAPEV